MGEAEKTCEKCHTTYTGNECPICSGLERVREMAARRRREYAQQKSTERAMQQHENTNR